MALTVKCNGGYKIYDAEFDSIDEACDHAKKMFRLYADSSGQGSGVLASELPRIDADIDRIRETGSGTVGAL
jgi:cobalamin biosynthesis protein CobT